jgi:hypothetical protein
MDSRLSFGICAAILTVSLTAPPAWAHHGWGGNSSFTLLRGTHLSFTATVRYPQTIGFRGTLRIESSSIPLNVLGFRVSPTGFFTSVSPTSWF